MKRLGLVLLTLLVAGWSAADDAVVEAGEMTLIIGVELSPAMVPGNPQDPITRCIEFEVSECEVVGGASLSLSQEVVFGQPDHISGHGDVEKE